MPVEADCRMRWLKRRTLFHVRTDLEILEEIVQGAGQLELSLDFGQALWLDPVAKRRYDGVVARLIEQMAVLQRSTRAIEKASIEGAPLDERWEAIDVEVRASRELLRSVVKRDVSIATALRDLTLASDRAENALLEIGRIIERYLG